MTVASQSGVAGKTVIGSQTGFPCYTGVASQTGIDILIDVASQIIGILSDTFVASFT